MDAANYSQNSSICRVDNAMEYANQGWKVFPLKPGKKVPLTAHGFKDATTSRHIIREWWKATPNANIGIATGFESGLVVFDFDVKNGQPGLEAYKKLQQDHALDTLRSHTPSGGIHLLFKYDGEDIGNRTGIIPGLDIRGTGGYIVAPGSSTPEGEYRWDDSSIAPVLLPDGLEELLKQEKTKAEAVPFDRKSVLDGVPEGQRDDKLYKYACSLQAKGNTREEAEALVKQAAENCKPPFDIDTVLEKVVRVYDKYESPITNTGGFVDTDMANAERFARLYVDTVFHTPECGWLIYDGKRWCIDEQHQVMRLAKRTARKIFTELEHAQNAQEKVLFNWARQSQSKHRLNAMLVLAQSEPGIPARLTEFDSEPLLLNCKNGVLNLATGKLLPHDQACKHSKISMINYDPAAQCPQWLVFLCRVMGNDDEMINFLQRAVGYTLTGDTGEQCLFFTYGTGANGKSVFLEILLQLLAEYGTNARADTFMLKTNGGGIPNDIARLVGMRFVGISETESGQRMAESLVKDMTGGDTVTARFLHKEFFSFRPEFKLWIRGNHKPNIRGTDDGIWRRIHLVPFEVQIPVGELDPRLPEKLRAELPGILRWAVDGALCNGNRTACKCLKKSTRQRASTARKWIGLQTSSQRGVRQGQDSLLLRVICTKHIPSGVQNLVNIP